MGNWIDQSTGNGPIHLPNDSIDARAAAHVGRHARLDLFFETRRGGTCLAHAYCEPPFRVGRCLTIGDAAYLIIVCSGPGVFGGDVLRQTIHVGRGARVVVTSQAALQIHPALCASAATIEQRYIVDDDAELHAHWDPVIPFAAARLAQRFDIRLAASGRLYWSDAIMAGRVRRGESWQFHELAHELRLSIGGRLSYLERYRLRPDSAAPARRWVAGRSQYVATMLVRHPRADAETAEMLHRGIADGEAANVEREASAPTCSAVDLVEPELLVGRMTAVGGVAFGAIRERCRGVVLDRVFESRRLAGRKSV